MNGRTFIANVWRRLGLENGPPWIRRTIVGIIGGTIALVGVALIFLPGPAFIVIPLGLAILATEFVWARRCLSAVRDWFRKRKKSVTQKA